MTEEKSCDRSSKNDDVTSRKDTPIHSHTGFKTLQLLQLVGTEGSSCLRGETCPVVSNFNYPSVFKVTLLFQTEAKIVGKPEAFLSLSE